MNTQRKLRYCFLACLLGIVSCSKKQPSVTEMNQQNSKKSIDAASVSSVSSVVSYSKDNTTTVTSINTSPGYVKQILYSIGPLTVQQYDVVSGHLQQLLTYAGTNNVQAASGILVATSPTAVDGNSPGWLGFISNFATSNLAYPQEATAEVMSRSGSYKFAAASSSIYINAVAYGAGSGTPAFTVPAGSGELVAVVERGLNQYSTTTYNLPYSSTEGKYYVPFDGATKHVQYALGPIDIPAQSMVDCRFQIEATSEVPNNSGNQQLGRNIIKGTSATATTGTYLTSIMASGIIWEEHHDTQSHTGGVYYGSAQTGAYFNSVLWALGTWTAEPIYIEPYYYGHMVVEVRPQVSSTNFQEDLTRNISSTDATHRVVYSVGPFNLTANQVVEVRYQANFAPSTRVSLNSTIIRASSATATTGITVQPALYRFYDPEYAYTCAVHSTAEKITTAANGQYYNVVVWSSGGLAVVDDGELEVVIRN